MGERTVKPLSEATFQEEWLKKKTKSLAQKQTNKPQLAITCSSSGRPAVEGLKQTWLGKVAKSHKGFLAIMWLCEAER